MGKSGSGKITLLNIVSLIDKPLNGIIKINGKVVIGFNLSGIAYFRRHHLGFIFQDFKLIDNLNVHENISLALVIKKYPKNKIDAAVKEIANAFTD